MKHRRTTVSILAVLLLVYCGIAFGGNFTYKVEHPHEGGDVTPVQANEMLQKDAAHTFLIDVRTQAEYELIGHPVAAHNIPLKFWSNDLDKEKGKYILNANSNFAKELLGKFNPKTDTVMFICRSGSRSCEATDAAVKAGWPADKAFNVMGGVEGNILKDPASPQNGQRVVGGWKNENLPWTYDMKKELLYTPAAK